MLAQLAIRDIVLIDQLTLDLRFGLTVLTGETGAGKSILLDAFSLALGGRGDGSLVRAGQTQGHVTAVFDVPASHPSLQLAAAQDIAIDGDLILRRVQMADGRSRAFINDQPVSVQTLRAVAAALVEIHGQHADRALMDPSAHRALVDAYGGLGAESASVRQAYEAWRKARKQLEQEQALIEKARKEVDFLTHAHAELSKLDVRTGEETQLAAERAAMMQAEKVVADLREAYESVAGDGSPLSILSSALRRLERRQSQAPDLIEPPARALEQALSALDHAQQSLDDALRAADFDPRRLEQIEERLFAIRAAMRKYAVSADQLPILTEQYARDLSALDASETRLTALTKAEAEAEAVYFRAANVLSAARRDAAAALDVAVEAELAPLKLGRARFMTQCVAETQPGPDGLDRLEFWVQTNPGARPGAMMKVASGGELSRFMLALKVVLADRGSAPTLVFDEIDSGVGGAVADAIGQRLARLAEKVQVLSVTHAPQVAARAQQHLRISKDEVDQGARVATRVVSLAVEQSREEIARMLAGEEITEEARAAAKRLVERAQIS